MNESLSVHEVCGQQLIPPGQSELEPVGHGREQSLVASSKVAPQKYESATSLVGSITGSSTAHVVCAKQVRFSGQSLLNPEGHGISQLLSASMKLLPQ